MTRERQFTERFCTCKQRCCHGVNFRRLFVCGKAVGEGSLSRVGKTKRLHEQVLMRVMHVIACHGKVAVGRPAAEICARQLVHRLVNKALEKKAAEGAARAVAARCAHEAVKDYVAKALW